MNRFALTASMLIASAAWVPTTAAAEQPEATWVFLKPRAVESDPVRLQAALAQAQRDANPRMLERRSMRRTAPGLLDARDLPLDREAVAAVTSIAPLRVESTWLNAVSVTATPEEVRAIRDLPCVARTQPVAHARRVPGGTGCEEPVPETGGSYDQRDFYGRSSTQLAQINLQALHARGYTGRNVIIAILDTGFYRIHQVFNNPAHPLQVIAERDFINRDDQTAPQAGDDGGQHVHGTLILSCIGSYLPDQMVGGAYDASFVLCKTEDVTSETPVEEDYYAAAIQFAENHGADVTTSSLAYSDWYTYANFDGRTAVTTIAVNAAAENGVHCCTAGGNAGHDANPATGSLAAPADGFKVLACGAVDAAGNIAGFSSDGPTADGRMKPEVLAQGVATACVNPYTADTYAAASGTSLSTPLLASVVACLTQAHPLWSVDQMREAIMHSASDFAATGASDPLFIRGCGVVNAVAAHDFFCPADFNRDGGVDGGDVASFFIEWERGADAADVNYDGGVDGSDVASFFIAWAAGGC
jgi:subtilisin family serine protease